MKHMTLMKIMAVAFAWAVVLPTALAQETTTTTTTTDPVTGTTTTQQTTTSASGTIVAYTPDADYITFRTGPHVPPVRYYYTKATTVVDPEGHIVSWSAVRPDIPATVYYTTVGDRVVVRKIVLAQPVTTYKTEETTTTTTTKP